MKLIEEIIGRKYFEYQESSVVVMKINMTYFETRRIEIDTYYGMVVLRGVWRRLREKPIDVTDTSVYTRRSITTIIETHDGMNINLFLEA